MIHYLRAIVAFCITDSSGIGLKINENIVHKH